MESVGLTINTSEMNDLLEPPVNITFDYYILDNPAVRFGLFALYSLIFCLCLLGNLAVVLIVTIHWRMRSVTKFCMGNLAFANLCVAVFCIYQNLFTFLQDDWIFGAFLCKMYHFTNNLSHSASILTLLVIFGERYLSIVHPLQCRRILTITRLRVIIVGVWVLSALISSPRLYYVTTFQVMEPDGHSEMFCAPKRTLYNSQTADIIYFIVLFLLPVLVMCLLYVKIRIIMSQSSALLHAASPVFTTSTTSQSSASEFCENRSRKTKFRIFPGKPQRMSTKQLVKVKKPSLLQGPAGSWMTKSQRKGQKLQSREAAFRMLIAIVTTFVICNLPYHLRKICQYHMANHSLWSSFHQLLTPITFLLMYTNCAMIPILYALMSKHFRSSLKDLLQFRLTKYTVVGVES